jgi:hypothetical protein
LSLTSGVLTAEAPKRFTRRDKTDREEQSQRREERRGEERRRIQSERRILLIEIVI